MTNFNETQHVHHPIGDLFIWVPSHFLSTVLARKLYKFVMWEQHQCRSL